MAIENDYLNGIGMLFGHLLTGSAQIFTDVRTYWSPDAVRRVTGCSLSEHAAEGLLHLINSGPAALGGTGEQTVEGKPAIKPWWLVTPEGVERCLKPLHGTVRCWGIFVEGAGVRAFALVGACPSQCFVSTGSRGWVP